MADSLHGILKPVCPITIRRKRPHSKDVMIYDASLSDGRTVWKCQIVACQRYTVTDKTGRIMGVDYNAVQLPGSK